MEEILDADKRQSDVFLLIEVIVAITIIAVMVGSAAPSYRLPYQQGQSGNEGKTHHPAQGLESLLRESMQN